MTPNQRKMERALEKMGTHTVDDVLDAVNDGRMQCFVAGPNESVLITQVLDFPRARVLQFFLAVGDMADMLDLERQACEFAASIGAKFMRAFARPGWGRAPIRHGAWVPVSTVWQRNA